MIDKRERRYRMKGPPRSSAGRSSPSPATSSSLNRKARYTRSPGPERFTASLVGMDVPPFILIRVYNPLEDMARALEAVREIDTLSEVSRRWRPEDGDLWLDFRFLTPVQTRPRSVGLVRTEAVLAFAYGADVGIDTGKRPDPETSHVAILWPAEPPRTRLLEALEVLEASA